MTDATKGNFWKKTAATLVLAFTAVAGLQQLAINDLSSRVESDTKQINTLRMTSTYADSYTPIHFKDTSLAIFNASTRGVNGAKEDFIGIDFTTKTTDGLQISNHVSFRANPDIARTGFDFYKTFLLEKLAARAEHGVSACDFAKQADYMLPEFAHAKQVFLDLNGDPGDSLAKNYKADIPPETRAALDGVKAAGGCKL